MFKKLLFITFSLTNIFNVCHATSYPINDHIKNTSDNKYNKSNQEPVFTQANTFFEYPNRQTFTPNELTTTSTMFFYTPALASQLGSVKNVKKFIVESVNISNTTYQNSGVPLEIKIAGIQKFYAPYDDTLNLNNGRFESFSDTKPNEHIKNLSASHFILVNRFYSQHHFSTGAGERGGIYAYISPQFNSPNGTRTFTHETGHLLGAMHDATINKDEALIEHAYGYNCNGYASTMSVGRNRGTPFLSSPHILINGQPCGDEHANFAKALSNQLDKNNNYLKDLPNIKPLEEPQGQFNFNKFRVIETEDKEYLQITVSFNDINKNTSVQLFSDSTLLKNFDNPIIASAQKNEIFLLNYELVQDWEYQQNTKILFTVEFPTQIKLSTNTITYNISSDETDIELKEINNTTAEKTKSGGISLLIGLLTPLAFIRRRQTNTTYIKSHTQNIVKSDKPVLN
ncbi:M12 family metallo-peptidase [Pseudoalteromonas marina]|uniref:M12 family metallo-peptidase n=1 Tax=Pseudoalteromonas marina TaxID=267375 RepID=A0ABT9FCF5_9GAMM|nr:M12 family metallo-peptidase [Pseudoalteromonas marina]MDP2564431.1 M12 family metallo-peptidase [Pseudoalteromonas marina]